MAETTKPIDDGGLLFEDLAAANLARAKQWNPSGLPMSREFAAIELAGEVGEVCNIVKKFSRAAHGIAGGREDYAALCDELADVVICTDLLAMRFGIDLAAAVVRKFNATSEKHGFTITLAARKAGQA